MTLAGAIRCGGGAKAHRGAADPWPPTAAAGGWSPVRPRQGARLQHAASVTDWQDSAKETASGGRGTTSGIDSETCVSRIGRPVTSPVAPPVVSPGSPTRSAAGLGASLAGFAFAGGFGCVGRGALEAPTVGFGTVPAPPPVPLALGDGEGLGAVLFDGVGLGVELDEVVAVGAGVPLVVGAGLAAVVVPAVGVVAGVEPVAGVVLTTGFPVSVGVAAGADDAVAVVGVGSGVAAVLSRAAAPDASGVDLAAVERVS
ncbi:hypothetical protein [Microtetraspora glauca]|uniref:Uncharacterized protein n=1 Tax=Microtetraspora glauca TaxID=1996 RepID=A0ABV3GE56_MICGL